MTLIVAACDKPEAKPSTNVEKDEKADTDTVPKGEAGGGSAGKIDADGAKSGEGGEEAPSPALYSFAFDDVEEGVKVAFTAGKYTKAVVETNKPAGDARAIKYTSSENAIATVDDAGVVTFVTQGTVTITATKALKGEYPEATARYTLYITMKPTNKQALVDEITRAMDAHGNEVDLNYIDTSAITDMSFLFSNDRTSGHKLAAFNGDISKWDVAAVTAMGSMFAGATSFNQDISGWNVARVTNMEYMFAGATSFNQDISTWKVARVTKMIAMFNYATAFKYNLDAWAGKLNANIKADGWVRASVMFSNSGLTNSLPSWCGNVLACKNRQI